MSFDTVAFQKGYKPRDPEFWLDSGLTKARNGRFVYNDDKLNVTVYPKGRGGRDWLWVQTSLPKMLFGHNAKLPNEAQAREAAATLCERVTQIMGLPFSIDDVKAKRIDYTRDYLIQEDKSRAIALALLAADVAGYEKGSREDSVHFGKTEGKTGEVIKEILVYPKWREVIESGQSPEVVEQARGKLRLEVRLRRAGLDGIKAAKRPLDFISESISDSLLNEAANMLDLERTIRARTLDFPHELIVHARRQGTLGTLGLIGFVQLVQKFGEHFHSKPGFNYPRSTYYKHRKTLEKLGLWAYIVAASEVQTAYE